MTIKKSVIACLAYDDIVFKPQKNGIVDIEMLYDGDAIAHISKQIAQQWYNDSFFDPEIGQKYEDLSLGQGYLAKMWETKLIDRIMQELGGYIQTVLIVYNSFSGGVLKYTLNITPNPNFFDEQIKLEMAHEVKNASI
jgi:hypothetical protein